MEGERYEQNRNREAVPAANQGHRGPGRGILGSCKWGYALQEPRQVGVVSAGAKDCLSEPVAANEIVDQEPFFSGTGMG